MKVSASFRSLMTALVVALPWGNAGAQASAALQAAVAQSGGRVIVTLKSTGGTGSQAAAMAPGSPAVSASELQTITEHLGTAFDASVIRTLPATSMVVATVDPARLSALLADANVAAVEADRLWFTADVDLPVPADRWAAYRKPARVDDTPWGVTQVTAPTVWAGGNKGDGIKVGVLDSGGDASHPDLTFAGGYDAINGNSINWNDDVGSCNGHGTHIAGTIAAKDDGNGLVGVAPHVQLYAIKVFQDVGGQCGAYTSSQIAGLNWAASQGIRLVNISIAGSSSGAYDAAIQSAAGLGTYVFAAAGNNGGAVTYPGSSPYAFGIGALDNTNARASFSDFGPEIDFSAPGVTIYSTMPGGGYGYKSGTSMATPHALGVAALILSADPSLSYAQLRQKLIDGALDLETAGFDNNTGYGLVRAANSISGGGGSPPAISMSVSPSSRNVSVQQGTAAPGSSGTVTLSGTGAGSATWSATKRKSWTTLTTAGGTGSGSVSWTRNTAGLGFGVWVDTITVSSSGATGSPGTIIDSLVITAPPAVTMAVSPTSRRATVQQGTTAPSDNATVTLSGTGSTSATWSATKRKSWTTLTTASGTGSGTVAWSRNSSGLSVGTYVDTISVTSSGATGSPGVVYDTLVITAAPAPLSLAVSPASRNVSIQQGGSAPGDNATVTLSGTGASSATWSATKRKSWTTLTTASGTGSGTVTWTRNTAALAVGTYVDTITVSSAGALSSPATILDTVVVTATATPLTLALTPGSRRASIVQGSAAPADSVTVILGGTGASSATWWGNHRQPWTTVTSGNGSGGGVGNGWLSWSRNASGLAPGVYVDTLSVAVSGGSGLTARIFDTLVINAASTPVALAVSPGSRSISVQLGTAAPGDNATVTLSGTGASTTAWSASKRKSWITLTSGSGTGSGTVSWTRNSSGLSVGTYVDTITVVATGVAGSPATVYDTLVISAATPPLTIAVSPSARSTSAQQGVAAPGDNATVSLTGSGASTTSWTATKRKSWTTLTTSTGIGSGTVTWSRNTAGLSVGTYVDTITVAAVGAIGSPVTVFDTLRITSASLPVSVAVSPDSRYATVVQGANASGDVASVTLSGTGASTMSWVATSRHSWTQFTTGAGVGSGTVAWNRASSGLAAGTYVDTITIALGGGNASTARLIDTLQVQAIANVQTTPKGKKFRLLLSGGTASIPGPILDSVRVEGSVAGVSSDWWTASSQADWLVLTTSIGHLGEWMRWQRLPAQVGPGVHVDTLRLSLLAAPSVQVIFVDTLEVVAVVAPSASSAIDDLFRPGAITEDQRQLLDRDGNNNGHYDLGDFLAWVEHNHISLSSAVRARMEGLLKAQPVTLPAGKAGSDSGGSNQRLW